MGLDVRLPLGFLFGSLGLLLVGFGLDPGHARSLGHNVNLGWGAVLVLFGALCLLLARRHRSAMRPAETTLEGRAAEEREHGPGLEHEGPAGHEVPPPGPAFPVDARRLAPPLKRGTGTGVR